MPGGYGRLVSGLTHLSTRTFTASLKMLSKVFFRSLSLTCTSPVSRMSLATTFSSALPNAFSKSSSLAKTPLLTLL